MQSEMNNERAEFQKMESAKLTLEKQVRNVNSPVYFYSCFTSGLILE